MNEHLKYILYLTPITLTSLYGCTSISDDKVLVDYDNIFYPDNTQPTTSIISYTFTTTTTTTTTSTITTIEPETTSSVELTEEVVVTDIPSFEPIIIEDNILYIRDRIIHFTQDYCTQENVDTYDVLYPIGYLMNGIFEEPKKVYPYTMLLGHDYKSFSILPYLYVGELFYMNINGEQHTYEIQRSESGYDSQDGTTIYSYTDDIDLLCNDYGYDALILITCYNSCRWVIVAKLVE